MGGFGFLLQPPSVAFTTFYTDAMLTPEQLYFHSEPYRAFPLSGLANVSARTLHPHQIEGRQS